MQPPNTPRPASRRRQGGQRWGRRLLVVALLVLAGVRLVPAVDALGQRFGPAGFLINPCTGETIALQERASFLPHLSSEQDGSREASVNAVGVSGIGSNGTYYLPLGTGKAVLTFANGTLEFATGGDLELIGRGTQGQDFHFHGLARLTLSPTSGLQGSGLTVRTRCG